MDAYSNLEFSKELNANFSQLEEYDNSLDRIDKVFSYGTCGFRYNETELDRVLVQLN